MEVTLLADHPHEVNIIAQWYYNEWGHISPNVTEEIVREKVVEKSINRNEIPLAIVIHDNSELVGVAELKYRENRNYPEYEHWLGGVFVNPSNRGRGISSLLVSEAKSKAVNLGIKQLYLQCESDNVDLYKKHGFKELHQASHLEITTTIMVWGLTS
ncbi:GNAT family N-acetyltransferase [Photobacterium makurazakiensis]|uniref:GNAT family N-acetyltransferase n=1 Tax=Photobacterium makurazakiensis TaxID=2910234 RepID=UPI003D0C6FC4